MVHIPVQKILVIDDDENYRTMISATLNTIGYDTIEAINGLDGLTAVKIHHPDLVLCDIKMPELDGCTLLGALKEHPNCVVALRLKTSANLTARRRSTSRRQRAMVR